MQIKNFTRQLLNVLSRNLPRRLIRREAMLEGVSAGSTTKDIPAELARQRLQCANEMPQQLYQRFHSHPEGLTEQEAEAIRLNSGSNLIENQQASPWWVHLWHCYRNPFNLLLTILALISYATEDLTAALVIGAMVLISTLMHFIQEARSNRAADALKAMVSNTATVLRSDAHSGKSEHHELPISQLVPGDIIKLSAGEQRDTLCFMGTNVVSGSALAIVIGTGNQTYFGLLAERVTHQDEQPNAFQSGISKVSWLLIRFMLVMTPIVLLINGFTKGDWWEAALFALSVAVGLTPEMLPMIVTSTLAKGAVKLSKQKVIVKRLDAIQNFGAMDVLCTDKTGTLTQDKILCWRAIPTYLEPIVSV